MVVLSPDAELPLLQLDLTKVYCIGGIVDRTVKRGTTLSYAVSLLGQAGDCAQLCMRRDSVVDFWRFTSWMLSYWPQLIEPVMEP